MGAQHDGAGASRSTAQGREAWITALSLLVVAALAGWLYGDALGLAFFNDDPTGNFAWMERFPLWQFFVSSAGYGFYRPLGFVLWKLLAALFGGYWAPGFHAVLLLLHMANAAMLWVLAFRATGSRAYAWTVALAFVAFPLSYEAVAYVAAMFHPLLTFWTLLAILLYERYRRVQRARWFAASYVALLLGLLTHENGVIIPLLLIGWEWLRDLAAGWRAMLRRRVLWFLPASALYGLLWISIPKSSGQGLRSLLDVSRNALAFSQIASYPALPWLRLSAGDVPRLVAVALVVLGLLYLVARLARRSRVYVYALLWIAVAALPSLAILEPAYLYGSPRLYYLPAVGAALLWAVPALLVERLFSGRPSTLLSLSRYALQGLLVLALCWPPLDYVRCQVYFLGHASDLIRSLARLTAEAPAGREIVWVNLPYFFSSCQRYPTGCRNPYPFAPVGAVILPPYASVADLARVNGGGPARPARSVLVQEYAPGWSLQSKEAISPQVLRSDLLSAQVYVLDFSAWSWFDLSMAWKPQAGPASDPLARFEETVALQGATVARQGDTLNVALSWRALRAPGRALTAFVHLYDASGTLVAQHDGPPAGGFVPAWMWQADDLVTDVHRIVPEKPLAPGSYTLVAGLYDSGSGVRLAARTVDGQPLANDAVVLQQLSWK